MKAIFNNDADINWHQWSGTKESLEKYLATNEGFFRMVNLRMRSPVIVHIEIDDIYIEIWPEQGGVEFIPQDTVTGKLA